MNLIYGALLIVKYSLQSIILLIVYVVLMNLFVDKNKMIAVSLKLLTIVCVCCVDKMVAASLKLLSEMESASIPSNEHASTTGSNANSSSVRARCDPAWDHVTEELKDGKSSYKCIHCGKSYKGGGINRMKRHLARIKGMVLKPEPDIKPFFF